MNWQYVRIWGMMLALVALGVALLWGMGFAVYLNRIGSRGWASTRRLLRSSLAVFLMALPVVIGFKEGEPLWALTTGRLGSAEGQYRTGILYHVGGAFLRPNPSKSVAAFRRAAAQGHALAQLALARSYYSGRGVLRDRAEALRWAKAAAQAGQPIAMVLAGEILSESAPAEAEPLFRQALPLLRSRGTAGDAEACFTLGTLHSKGQGVAQDPVEGLAWMLLARKLGISPFQELALQSFEKRIPLGQRSLAHSRAEELSKPPGNG